MTFPERAHHQTWLVIGLLLGMGLGFAGHRIVDAVPTFVETPLLRTDLVDIGTHELMVLRLDTSPGWEHGRHYHAGHELVYVLEGTGALRRSELGKKLVGLGVDLDGNSREALAADPHAEDAILVANGAVANGALLHLTLLASWRARRPGGQTWLRSISSLGCGFR